MRVMTLGGTRFIGLAIVAELRRGGHEVLLVHRGAADPEELADLEHVHVDRDDLGSVRDQLDAWNPDAVVDTCAISGAQVDTTLAALPDARLVVLSSMDVYEAYGALHEGRDDEPVPVDETSPVRAKRYPYRGQIPGMDDYEKLDVEERYLGRGGTVLRLPMVYGEHDYQRREEFVLRRVRAGRTAMPFGAGNFVWTKAYVGDVARGVRLAVEHDTEGDVFNLGEHRTWTIRRWAREIVAAAGAELDLVTVPDDSLPDDLGTTGAVAQHLLVDSARARERLGWSETDPAEAVHRSVAWHLEHPPERDGDDDFSADETALASAI
jgi:nucleoside-diphosphate-sugar epimerase